MELKFNILA